MADQVIDDCGVLVPGGLTGGECQCSGQGALCLVEIYVGTDWPGWILAGTAWM